MLHSTNKVLISEKKSVKSVCGFKCQDTSVKHLIYSMYATLPHLCSYLCCPQVDKLEEAESQRKTEEEVTEPQPMVFGRLSCTAVK